MKTINKIYKSEIEVKKSTFIAYLTPISEFKSLYEELNKEHPKARHIVWVKRYLNEYNQIAEYLNDDNEPKGSAAPSMMNVLRGEDIINVAILCVRYFGGIKLGIGGLVRAYGSAAKEVIKNAKLLEFVEKNSIIFFISYHYLAKFEHYFSTKDINLIKKEFLNEGVEVTVELSQKERDEFLEFAKEYERDGFRLKISL